jgi:hypothetical protein
MRQSPKIIFFSDAGPVAWSCCEVQSQSKKMCTSISCIENEIEVRRERALVHPPREAEMHGSIFLDLANGINLTHSFTM